MPFLFLLLIMLKNYEQEKVKTHGFEPLRGLISKKKTMRGADRQVLEDLLRGKEKFAPEIERYIAKKKAELKTTRVAIIEQAIVRAMKASQSQEAKRGKKRL